MIRPDIDNQRSFDWGRTSEHYAKFRPGYTEDFYDILAALGIGLPGQQILDLGTGTGVLARAFAKRGASVRGIDIAENQIEQAKRLAFEDEVDVVFDVCPAEELEAAPGPLDVISAGQSWLYFDADVLIPKVLDALKPDGRLVMTTLAWLPFRDPIAKRSDDLVLQFNPDWKGAGHRGSSARVPPALTPFFDLATYHAMVHPMRFTRETWRGRFLACRGIGASLSDQEIQAFDNAHEEMLIEHAGESFEILHEMVVHVFVRKGVLRSEEGG